MKKILLLGDEAIAQSAIDAGLLFPINNYCILFLNLNEKYKFSEKTIEHELYHYFQIVLHINICKEKYRFNIV